MKIRPKIVNLLTILLSTSFLLTGGSVAHHIASEATALPHPLEAPLARSDYVAPAGGDVIHYFDKPAHNWLPGHRGVDISAQPGDFIVAAGSGTIAYAGTVAGVPVVSIDHPDGIRTTYQPVLTSLPPGTTVTAGQPVGTLAPEAADPSVSHCGAAPCLHWGARTGPDTYIDPLALLGRRTIRLLIPV